MGKKARLKKYPKTCFTVDEVRDFKKLQLWDFCILQSVYKEK